MAAPHVSGVAALVWNYLTVNDPANANSTEVRRRIQDCADKTGAMGQNMLVWSKYGRLNARGALTCGGGGGGGGNTPPNASFAFVPSDLNVAFTDQSTDADGTVMSRAWNFGDSGTSLAPNPSHTYTAAGTYSVTLTVTDDGGATDAIIQDVTVPNAPGDITLTADGYKAKGLQKADLTWLGASEVDVYRDGIKIDSSVTSPYTDPIDQRGGGSYTYRVCETGTSPCSNEVTVNF
jgi:PKD repeat protein